MLAQGGAQYQRTQKSSRRVEYCKPLLEASRPLTASSACIIGRATPRARRGDATKRPRPTTPPRFRFRSDPFRSDPFRSVPFRSGRPRFRSQDNPALSSRQHESARRSRHACTAGRAVRAKLKRRAVRKKPWSRAVCGPCRAWAAWRGEVARATLGFRLPEPEFLGFPFLPFRSDFLPRFLRIAEPCPRYVDLLVN